MTIYGDYTIIIIKLVLNTNEKDAVVYWQTVPPNSAEFATV